MCRNDMQYVSQKYFNQSLLNDRLMEWACLFHSDDNSVRTEQMGTKLEWKSDFVFVHEVLRCFQALLVQIEYLLLHVSS